MDDDILSKYVERYNTFFKITDINLEDRCKELPYEKNYWVTELITQKRSKLRLEKKIKNIKKQITKIQIDEGLVSLNKKTIDSIEDAKEIVEIKEQIEQLNFIIEYLEYTTKNISFIGNDIKNIIALKQLEEF